MANNCSLNFFTPSCFATFASGASNADGEIFVSAMAGNGSLIRFNLGSDFTYPTGGVSGGSFPDSGQYTFENLTPGTYTVYARNSINCSRTLQLTVGYVTTYNPKYRLDFYDNVTGSEIKCRFDIEQLSYIGEVTDVTGSSNPVRPDWGEQGDEDPFKPVIGSELNATLVSITADQFNEFSEADEREYRGSYYIWEDGDYVLKWRGYMTVQNQSEPYVLQEKYDVNLQFTDGLADLADIEFSDNSGNIPTTRISLMSGILFCLYKTNIELQVWETVNLYEQSMDDEVSMLAQAYFNPKVYVHDGVAESCLDVLTSLMRTVGSRISQSHGHWQIDLITKKSKPAVTTRKHSFNGGSISTSDVNYQVLLRRGSVSVPNPKVSWMNANQFRNITTVVGTINVVADLGLEEENNLLAESKFKAVDIENGQFEGWATSSPNPSPELASVPGRGNVLKIPFEPSELGQLMNVIADDVAIEASSDLYEIRISFDIMASPSMPSYWLYFDMALSITGGNPDDYHLGPVSTSGQGESLLVTSEGAATYLIDDEFLRIYIDDTGAWKTMTFSAIVDPDVIGSSIDGNLELKFRFDGNYYFDDLAGLKDVETVGLISKVTDNRRRAMIQVDALGDYMLEPGTDAEDSPNVIRPNDFNASTNPYVWRLKNQTSFSSTFIKSMSGYFLLDNVVVQYLPLGSEPESQFTSEVTTKANNKRQIDVPLRHFDIANVDENYKNITYGWLSLEDGTPTENWQFLGSGGGGLGSAAPKTLIDRVQAMYRTHYQIPRWNLTGEMMGHGVFPDIGNSFYEVGTGRTYLPVALIQNPREKSLTGLALIEILSGGEPVDETDPDVIPPPPAEDIEPPEPPEQDTAGIFTAAFVPAYV